MISLLPSVLHCCERTAQVLLVNACLRGSGTRQAHSQLRVSITRAHTHSALGTLLQSENMRVHLNYTQVFK